MAKLSTRFFAIFFAVLFLVTSSSVAIAFIISNIQSKDAAKNSKTAQTTPSQTSTPSSTASLQSKILPNFTPVSSVTQLQTKDLTVGAGATVKSGQTISVTYSGAVAATGIIFQSSTSPVSLNLSQVITGWQKGIPGMKVGGTRQLLIPASEAYGANPPSGSNIPPNAALVFDVTVKSIGG